MTEATTVYCIHPTMQKRQKILNTNINTIPSTSLVSWSPSRSILVAERLTLEWHAAPLYRFGTTLSRQLQNGVIRSYRAGVSDTRFEIFGSTTPPQNELN